MPDVHGWHASPRRGVPASREADTGEIRLPLALFHLDQHQGDLELVLSRIEAEHLHATLCRHLDGQCEPTARPR